MYYNAINSVFLDGKRHTITNHKTNFKCMPDFFCQSCATTFIRKNIAHPWNTKYEIPNSSDNLFFCQSALSLHHFWLVTNDKIRVGETLGSIKHLPTNDFLRLLMVQHPRIQIPQIGPTQWLFSEGRFIPNALGLDAPNYLKQP